MIKVDEYNLCDLRAIIDDSKLEIERLTNLISSRNLELKEECPEKVLIEHYCNSLETIKDQLEEALNYFEEEDDEEKEV